MQHISFNFKQFHNITIQHRSNNKKKRNNFGNYIKQTKRLDLNDFFYNIQVYNLGIK